MLSRNVASEDLREVAGLGHQAILDAIKKRDPAGVLAAMEVHLAAGYLVVRTSYESRAAAAGPSATGKPSQASSA